MILNYKNIMTKMEVENKKKINEIQQTNDFKVKNLEIKLDEKHFKIS